MVEAADFQPDRLSLNHMYSLIAGDGNTHKSPSACVMPQNKRKHTFSPFSPSLSALSLGIDFYFDYTGCSLAQEVLPSCLRHKQAAHIRTESALMAN